MLRHSFTFLVAFALALPAFPATNPFVGTWKFNPEKSDLQGQTETIASLGDNKYRFTYGTAVSFDITADGSDQTSLPGATMAITVQDPNTWQVVDKSNGTTNATGVWTLSQDGKSISAAVKGTKPDGSQFANHFNLKKLAGSASFAGTWQIADVKLSAPSLLQIDASATDGLIVAYPTDKVTMTISMDGKECPVEGPTVLKGSTISARRIGLHTVKTTDRLNAKVMDTTDWKLSSDGKVLTMIEHDPGVKKPVVSVYDRQ
jgi:hypothetical protein